MLSRPMEPVMANLSSCPSSVKPRPPRRRTKVVYRVRNWADYEAGLQQRGSLTVWFTPQAVRSVVLSRAASALGRQYTFSEVAIPNGVDATVLGVSLAPTPNRQGYRRFGVGPAWA